MTRRTKIVATIGPATESEEQLAKLIEAGVNVVRLNLSHGPAEDHLARLSRVRAVANRLGAAVGVLADLPGPKIRCGAFPEGGVLAIPGAPIVVTYGDGASDDEVIHIDYPLVGIVAGDRLTVGDGGINLIVDEVLGDAVRCRVETGGRMQGRPGVHLPSDRTHLESPTEHDLELAETFAAAGADFIAVSFVRRGDDVRRIAEVVQGRSELVAKIETRAAINHMDEFLEAADVIMVARGDLGIDVPLPEVPHLQKTIIRRCVEYGVPVITATQMLESMVNAPAPTRAEVSDVANAVFDGTDALMLSGETAIGDYPIETVRTMSAIAERAEAEASYRQWATRLGRIQRQRWDSTADRITAAITHAASEAAVDAGATTIICCTLSGRTAKAMARFRPEQNLIGMSPRVSTVRQMSLSWGVDPIEVDTYESTDEMVWFAIERALALGRIAHGDVVAVVAGAPSRGSDTAADVLRVVRVV